jgi:hypothetical protein
MDLSRTFASEGFMAGDNEARQKALEIEQSLWLRLVMPCILIVIAPFFNIRILRSHTAKRFLSGIKTSHVS